MKLPWGRPGRYLWGMSTSLVTWSNSIWRLSLNGHGNIIFRLFSRKFASLFLSLLDISCLKSMIDCQCSLCHVTITHSSRECVFYRLQPNLATRSKQIEGWCDLILGYHKHYKIYSLDVQEAQSSPIFSNKKVDRILNHTFSSFKYSRNC